MAVNLADLCEYKHVHNRHVHCHMLRDLCEYKHVHKRHVHCHMLTDFCEYKHLHKRHVHCHMMTFVYVFVLTEIPQHMAVNMTFV